HARQTDRERPCRHPHPHGHCSAEFDPTRCKTPIVRCYRRRALLTTAHAARRRGEMVWDVLRVVGWAIMLAMIPIVARRHAPGKAWGWLAIIFLSPYLGLALYLL